MKSYRLKDYSEFKLEPKGPMKIYYDNKVVIRIAHNQVQSDCTKHVELGKHLMKEKIETE